MTKEQFLQDFKDINYMYNNSMMLDSLENHINDLLETELEKIKAEVQTEEKDFDIYDNHDKDVLYGLHLGIEIIDKHIKENKE